MHVEIPSGGRNQKLSKHINILDRPLRVKSLVKLGDYSKVVLALRRDFVEIRYTSMIS